MFFRPNENPNKTMVLRRVKSIGKEITNSIEKNPEKIEPSDKLIARIMEVECEWKNLGDNQ